MNIAPAILLSALFIGVSAALLGAFIVHAVLAVPPEDRSWLDRPPAFIRWLWWPSRLLGFWIAPLLPMSWREHQLVRLRLAGLDYVLSPAQLLAHRIVMAGVGAASGALMASGWNLRPASLVVILGAGLAVMLSLAWFADRIATRRRQRLKTLPFFLDLITLCVEAGLNLTGALQQSNQALWNPPPRDPSWLGWAQGEARNLLYIFLIILALLLMMRLLERLGIIAGLTRLLRPVLTLLGISERAAPRL